MKTVRKFLNNQGATIPFIDMALIAPRKRSTLCRTLLLLIRSILNVSSLLCSASKKTRLGLASFSSTSKTSCLMHSYLNVEPEEQESTVGKVACSLIELGVDGKWVKRKCFVVQTSCALYYTVSTADSKLTL